MPWESIGDVDTGEGEDSWTDFARSLAKSYIEFVCGPPPEGCEITEIAHDHDCGAYTTLGVTYDLYCPQDYIRECTVALYVFDQAVDWGTLKEHFESVAFAEDKEEDEAWR